MTYIEQVQALLDMLVIANQADTDEAQDWQSDSDHTVLHRHLSSALKELTTERFADAYFSNGEPDWSLLPAHRLPEGLVIELPTNKNGSANIRTLAEVLYGPEVSVARVPYENGAGYRYAIHGTHVPYHLTGPTLATELVKRLKNEIGAGFNRNVTYTITGA